MLSIGKSMLVFGNVEPMCEVYRKINEISSGQLIGIAGTSSDRIPYHSSSISE
jgi:hypothetical protein